MRAALHTVWLLATAILGAESDRETVYSYLSKSVSDDGAEVPLHLRSHPVLKLALGDMVGFVGSDFSLLELEDGGGGDDDSLWLVHQLASRLAGGVKAGAGEMVLACWYWWLVLGLWYALTCILNFSLAARYGLLRVPVPRDLLSFS